MPHENFIKKTHKVHMNKIQLKDFKNMFIRHKNLRNKKKTFSNKLLKIKFNFDLSKLHNYHLIKVLKKKNSHLIYYFIFQAILIHYKQFEAYFNMNYSIYERFSQPISPYL